MKGHKIALGGSFSGDTTELFRGIPHDDVLQFCLVGREVTLQIKSEKLDSVVDKLKHLGVNNLNILEWRKMGTTIAQSGQGQDEKNILNISLIPTTMGDGLRPLSVTQRFQMERKHYIELLAHLEVTLQDAGVSDVLYVMQVEKEVNRNQYLDAVKDATLNALFNAGGVIGIE